MQPNLLRAVGLLLACVPSGLSESDAGPIVEIDFEPLDGGPGGDPGPMIAAMMQSMGAMGAVPPLGAMGPGALKSAAQSSSGSQIGRTKKADREGELDRAMQGMFGKQPKQGPQWQNTHVQRENDMDRAIQAMLGDMFGGPDGPGGPVRSVAGFGGLGPAAQMLRGPTGSANGAWRSPDGSQVITFDSSGGQSGPIIMGGGDGPPLDLLRGLFPGPLMIEDDGSAHPVGMRQGPAVFGGGPDPLIMNMLQDMGDAFQNDMMQSIHATPHASRAPNSCHADIQTHCSTARSPVHCLGQHQADISANCRKDVGKSVPFLCHSAIDKYCDVLQTGLLTCLGSHIDGVSGECKDAVLATQQVVAKVAAGSSSTSTVKPISNAAMSVPLLDSAANQLAKAADDQATASLLGNTPATQPATESTSSRFWVFLMMAVAVALVYAFMFSDVRRRAYTALKPYIYTEAAQPLRGGVKLELPKPVEI